MATNDGSIRTGDDPTAAILSESQLHKNHVCDYVINVATGCRHGCRFCYVPSTPAIRARPEMLATHADVEDPAKEWGQYVLYRDDIPERLDGLLERKRTWKTTEFGQGIVGVSFGTDCYMDTRAAAITREVIQTLAKHDRHVRILTRNPGLALADMDVYRDAGPYVTIGTSIPALDATAVGALEPRAPPPRQRLQALEEFRDQGVRTYVAVSPTYPTLTNRDLHRLLDRIEALDPDVVFHEVINPRGGNLSRAITAASAAGHPELAEALEQLCDREQWLAYSFQQFRAIQRGATSRGIDLQLVPDSLHLQATSGPNSAWLSKWKARQSPESFANRPEPTSPMPPIPDT